MRRIRQDHIGALMIDVHLQAPAREKCPFVRKQRVQDLVARGETILQTFELTRWASIERVEQEP